MLADYLIGDGLPPEVWTLGIIAEEFGVPLTDGGADVQPYYLSLELVEYRAFARAWEIVKRAQSEKELPDHPIIQTVRDIMGAQIKARQERDRALRLGKGKATA